MSYPLPAQRSPLPPSRGRAFAHAGIGAGIRAGRENDDLKDDRQGRDDDR